MKSYYLLQQIENIILDDLYVEKSILNEYMKPISKNINNFINLILTNDQWSKTQYIDY